MAHHVHRGRAGQGNVIAPSGKVVAFNEHGVSGELDKEDYENLLKIPGYYHHDGKHNTAPSVPTQEPEPLTPVISDPNQPPTTIEDEMGKVARWAGVAERAAQGLPLHPAEAYEELHPYSKYVVDTITAIQKFHESKGHAVHGDGEPKEKPALTQQDKQPDAPEEKPAIPENTHLVDNKEPESPVKSAADVNKVEHAPAATVNIFAGADPAKPTVPGDMSALEGDKHSQQIPSGKTPPARPVKKG